MNQCALILFHEPVRFDLTLLVLSLEALLYLDANKDFSLALTSTVRLRAWTSGCPPQIQYLVCLTAWQAGTALIA